MSHTQSVCIRQSIQETSLIILTVICISVVRSPSDIDTSCKNWPSTATNEHFVHRGHCTGVECADFSRREETSTITQQDPVTLCTDCTTACCTVRMSAADSRRADQISLTSKRKVRRLSRDSPMHNRINWR